MSQNSTLYKLIKDLSFSLAPFREVLSDVNKFKAFARSIGWTISDLPNEYSDLAQDIETLIHGLLNLGSDPSISEVFNLIDDFGTLYDSATSVTTIPQGANVNFINEFGKKLFDYLLTSYLSKNYVKVFQILKLINVIEFTYVQGNFIQPAYVKNEIHYQSLGNIISSPIQSAKYFLNWNNGLKFSLLFDFLFELAAAFRLNATSELFSSSMLHGYSNTLNTEATGKKLSMFLLPKLTNVGFREIELEVIPYYDVVPSNNGIVVQITIPSQFSLNTSISDNFELDINTASAIGQPFGFLITPNDISFSYPLQQNTQFPNSNIRIDVEYTPDAPSLLLGDAAGTRLALQNANLSFNAIYANNEFELIIETDLSGLEFTIAGGESDGFISKILGDEEKKIKLPIIVSWSSKHGIRFKGSGAFEIAVNPNINIGPVQIRKLMLALMAVQNQPIKTVIGATIAGELGPVAFIVEEVGLALKLDTNTNNGNAGPFDIDLGFKPPSGIALSIDTKALKGGGYVYINPDKGLYYGAFELDIVDKLGVSAIAIITTKKPDGTKGFSLLVTIAVTFPTSIPIGFGFSLTGVGGMGGVNRDVDPIPIRDGVRNGTIDNILFPKDVIENIDSIINDLTACFPAAEGRYTFGVFFLLGWGVGIKLIDIKFGIIVNLPSPVRLLIIGVVKIALPKPEAPIVKINVAFAGYIDFGKKFMLFDASIYDSKILILSIEGDIAARIFWGEHREMLISVGGFHPAYSAPTYLMLPTQMRRLSISIVDTDVIKLKLATYFAITSNTVQFGARIDFLFKLWKFEIIGLFGIDVLFQFKPFKMMAETYARIAVIWDDEPILDIQLRFFLEGPGPWHARGNAIFTFLGMTHTPQFDRTFGDHVPQAEVPGIAIMPRLLEALAQDESWSTDLPGEKQMLVQVKNLDSAGLVMHPLGVLAVVQKVVPLGMKIQRYGTQVPTDGGEYNITAFNLGGDPQIRETVREGFAPAQFRNMSDKEKLESAAFEYLKGGERVVGTQSIETDGMYVYEPEYETIVVDGDYSFTLGVDTVEEAFLNNFTSGGLLGKNAISRRTKDMIKRPTTFVRVRQERFKIVFKDSLDDTSYGTFNSLAEALTVKDTITPDTVLVVPVGGDYNYPLLGVSTGGGGVLGNTNSYTNVIQTGGVVLVGGFTGGIVGGGMVLGGGVTGGIGGVQVGSINHNSYYQVGNLQLVTYQ